MDHMRNIRMFTNIMDNKFSFGPFKFGIEPIIGLIPWFGDLIGFVLSFYIIWAAHQYRVPDSEMRKMYFNMLADLFIGLIPIVGDAFDFFWKANTKNLNILEKYAKDPIIEGKVV